MNSQVILFLALIILISTFSCRQSTYREEIIELKAHNIDEGCDEFNHLWEVDSVSDPNYGFLIGEIFYSKMIAEKIHRTSNEPMNILTIGQLSKQTHHEDYTCRNTWLFLSKRCKLLIE